MSTQPVSPLAHTLPLVVTPRLTLSQRARELDYVREDQSHGQNHGSRVNGIQRWSGGSDGDSWCCEFVTMLLDVMFKGNAPIPRGGACQEVYALAKAKHWIAATPSVDDLFLFVATATDHAHHIGVVSCLVPLAGIAGNTSLTGASSNGDGVHEHALLAPAGSQVVYVHWPRGS